MRYPDINDQSYTGLAQPAERAGESLSQRDGQVDQSSVAPTSCVYASISTERIMQAVEQQRHISQQLEDLRTQQAQRTAFLRTTGLKLLVVLWSILGVLMMLFGMLLLARPALLARTVDALSGTIAALLMVEGRAKVGLSLIPLGSWLLSGAALVMVLLMGLWVRLMRYPHEI